MIAFESAVGWGAHAPELLLELLVVVVAALLLETVVVEDELTVVAGEPPSPVLELVASEPPTPEPELVVVGVPLLVEAPLDGPVLLADAFVGLEDVAHASGAVEASPITNMPPNHISLAITMYPPL